jgi:glycosyltransferase involved in cell wall biosynthesis
MSRDPPAVSVIVPAWGAAHLVGEALTSLIAQRFTDWEAVVVDDGGPAVGDAVAPFAAADPRIRFLSTPHGGVSAARNHAIAAARAPLVALLDGDDRYRPDYLEKMVAAIRADPALGFVTCDATFTGDTPRDGQRFSAYLPQAGEPTLEAVIARRFNIFIACIIRREAVSGAGGFDEGLRSSEDLDLWIRMLEGGWRAGLVPEPLVFYRRRAGSLSSATRRLRQDGIRMYEQAVARLAGRPEALAAATTMIARLREEIAWSDGEDLVIEGRVADGLALLRRSGAERRSPRWRMMMPLFRLAPPLARPVLSWRRRQEERA